MTDVSSKRVVVYHYFEKNEEYKDNFIFFISTAWSTVHDYIIIVAGEVTIELPNRKNIKYVFTKNLGHDFAGHSAVADVLVDNHYKHIIFVNCTARGPFFPSYIDKDWTSAFVQLLDNEIHLCGTTINILHGDRPFSLAYESAYPSHTKPYSHVQSYAFAMTQECFIRLVNSGFYKGARYLTKEEAVVECEIKLSQLVKRWNWNITSVLAPYQGIDYRVEHTDHNWSTKTGHPLSPGAYFGLSVHPLEVIFLKTGWRIMNEENLNLYTLNYILHQKTGLDEWEECERLITRLKVKCNGIVN